MKRTAENKNTKQHKIRITPGQAVSFSESIQLPECLFAISEEWRSASDRGDHVAAVFMELFKAFDCLPPCLITDKLTACGLSKMQSS